MKTRKLIIANWKMNKTNSDAKKYMDEFVNCTRIAKSEVVICPPFTSIESVSKKCCGININIGAQNCHFENSGAFTGEISCSMLCDLGVKYVIVGHSERRANFFETDEIVNKKLKTALKNNLTPILCVGETFNQRENQQSKNVVISQIEKAFKDVNIADVSSIVIAYEPVWAIGSGAAATLPDATEMCGSIRDFIAFKYGELAADNVRIIYGGSLNEKNAKEFLSCQEIDGGLIGGASLNVKSFASIINIADDCLNI